MIRLRNVQVIKKSQVKEFRLSISELQLRSGESVLIQGVSGSGKTTLLSLLALIDLPNQGEIEFLGRSLEQIKSENPDRIRANHIGYVFQQFNLLPYLTSIQNVGVAAEFSSLRRSRVSDVDTEAFRLLKSLGLEAELNLRPGQLSLGQQQRVALARALLGRPEVLLLDEPTSALDQKSAGLFMELLFKSASEYRPTIIMVSHDPSWRGRFDRQILMEDFV